MRNVSARTLPLVSRVGEAHELGCSRGNLLPAPPLGLKRWGSRAVKQPYKRNLARTRDAYVRANTSDEP